MSVEHINRRGHRYYVFEGRTKTGKPKYYASKSATSKSGQRVDSLPEDFEIFENPGNATVTVRRRKRSRIVDAERQLVERLALELSAHSHLQTIIDGNRIVVYTPATDPVASTETFARIFGSAPPRAVEWTARTTSYDAELRFDLADADKRLYTAERYCYRGGMEGWIWIGGPAPLEQLARKLLPDLGRDSWYDLL